MLKLSNVNKTFFPNSINERIALSNIQLELLDGDFGDHYWIERCRKIYSPEHHRWKNFPRIPEQLRLQDKRTRMKDFRRAKYVGRVFQDPMAGTAPELTIEQNMALANVEACTEDWLAE